MTTTFIRNPDCWKNGIVPQELMTEQDAITEAEYIKIREVIEND